MLRLAAALVLIAFSAHAAALALSRAKPLLDTISAAMMSKGRRQPKIGPRLPPLRP